jgi:tetratricopeptide (TPR) repeat protein
MQSVKVRTDPIITRDTGAERRFNELFEAREYTAALVEARTFEAAVREQVGTLHLQYAVALDYLGKAYEALLMFVDAEKAYRQALSIKEFIYGANDVKVITSLSSLAKLDEMQEKYADAENVLKRAVAICDLLPEEKQCAGDESPFDGLASLYESQERDRDRVQLLEQPHKRNIALIEKRVGMVHADLLYPLGRLADMYIETGRQSEAEAVLKRMTIICETLPTETNCTSSLFDALAKLYESQKRYVDAENVYKRAIALFETRAGSDRDNLSHVLDHRIRISTIYSTQGKYADAEAALRQAVAICEKLSEDWRCTGIFGPYYSLAKVYEAKKQFREAEQMYKRREQIYKRRIALAGQFDDSDHQDMIELLTQLTELYITQKNYNAAEKSRKRMVSIAKQLGDVEIAKQLRNVELLRLKLMSSILEKKGGDDLQESPISEYTNAIENLAASYSTQKRYREEKEMREGVVAVIENFVASIKSSDADNTYFDLVTALRFLAKQYQLQNRDDDAEAALQQALVMGREEQGQFQGSLRFRSASGILQRSTALR